MSFQRQFAQRQPFSSTCIQHGSQRHGAFAVTRAPRTTSKRQSKRSQVLAAFNVQEALGNLKQQAQKQKTAAVLGALGVVASGLTVAGDLLSCHSSAHRLSTS